MKSNNNLNNISLRIGVEVFNKSVEESKKIAEGLVYSSLELTGLHIGSLRNEVDESLQRLVNDSLQAKELAIKNKEELDTKDQEILDKQISDIEAVSQTIKELQDSTNTSFEETKAEILEKYDTLEQSLEKASLQTLEGDKNIQEEIKERIITISRGVSALNEETLTELKRYKSDTEKKIKEAVSVINSKQDILKLKLSEDFGKIIKSSVSELDKKVQNDLQEIIEETQGLLDKKTVAFDSKIIVLKNLIEKNIRKELSRVEEEIRDIELLRGPEGPQGEKGESGSPDTPEQIKEKLEKLPIPKKKKDKWFDAGHIKNLDSFVSNTTVYGGGGITSHSKLTNLEWSKSGHTIDTDIDMGGNGFTNVSLNADQVSIVDIGGYYTGTEVESALQEIGASSHAPVTAGDGISVVGQVVSNIDKGSSAVTTHESTYTHSDIALNTSSRHNPVTVTDSTEIDFTLTDQDITASVKDGSITVTKLNTDVQGEFVNVSGDTMTGTLNLPSNGLVVGTNQLVVSGGNVGVGVASPEAPLHVESSVGAVTNFLILESNRNAGDTEVGILFKDRSSISTGQEVSRIWTERQGTSGNFDLVFQAGNGTLAGLKPESIRIRGNTGYVGLGTSSPSSILDVHANAGSNAAFSFTDGDMSANNYGTIFSPTVTTGTIGRISNWSVGGFVVNGFAGGDTEPGVVLHGYTYDTTPNEASVIIAGWKPNGTNSRQALSGTEKILTIRAGTTERVTFQADGNVGVGTNTPGAKLQINTTASTVGQVVRGAVSQTANLFEAQDSGGTVLAKVDKDGAISSAGYKVAGAVGIDQVATILDGDGVSTHTLTFTKGILTAYNKV